MTKPLIGVVVAVILAAGCDSRPALTFPSAAPPPTVSTPPPPPNPTPPSPPNTREPGPVPIAGTRITPGEVARGTINGTDPACFPNWDSAGRCRLYELMASTDGTLHGTLRVSGPSRGIYNPELFLVASDGTWAWAPESWPERSVSMPARRGETYRIVVLAYGPFPEAFEVTAELSPEC